MVLPPYPRALPAPKIGRDAAKASKRLEQTQFEPIVPETLTRLVGFPNMAVTHLYIEEQEEKMYLHLECQHQHDVAICPRCQQPAVSGYDHKKRSVRHLDIFGMRTIIHFDKRRFDCEGCDKAFSELLTWIAPKRRQTRAYEQYIYEQVKKQPVSMSPSKPD
jgi:transposase